MHVSAVADERTAALERLRTAWPGDLLALAAGLLAPLAFAPFHLFVLAVIAPALLLVAWYGVSAGYAARRGLLFGLGMFGVGASWIVVSVHEFGHTPLVPAGVLTAFFVMVLALFPALAGYVTVRLSSRSQALAPLIVFPAVWTLLEWVRGWLFTGFPWLHLGYSQVSGPLGGYAPWVGVYGVSWAVAVSAGALAWLVWARAAQRALALGLVAVLWVAGPLLGKVEWTAPEGEPLKVALVQGNVSQHLKWKPDQREMILERYRARTAEHWDADLIIWPETAIPDFYDSVADTHLAELSADAQAHGTDLLVGVPVRQSTGGHTRYFNSMVSVGTSIEFYHKRHLVPFGEYVPFGDVVRALGGIFNVPMSDFAPGDPDQPPLRVAGHDVGVSICYEDAFGEEIIQVLPDADLLVNVSNDAWFGDSLAPHQHLQMARMRALETGRPMLRATNTGVSAVIDHRGEVVARSPQFEVDTLSAAVQPRSGATPYVRTGNTPIVTLLFILLGLGALGNRLGLD